MNLFSHNAERNNSSALAAGQHHRPLHRIREARIAEGLSLRAVSRRIHVTVSKLAAQEDGFADLKLSDLYLWQQGLDVPLAELLVEPEQRLQEPIRQRACLVRIAKTAASLLENSRTGAMRRLAQNLRNQLIELMPELDEVRPWPTCGKRRTREELGRTAVRIFPDVGNAMHNQTDGQQLLNRDSA